MRLAWVPTAVVLLLSSTGLVSADVFCDESVSCEVGCCGSNNACGTGPDYCSKDKCINSCDYKAECNPGKWSSQYFKSAKCPLNVCCSKFGFCGTTEEFCGNETVKRPSCDSGSQSVKRVIGYYGSGGASRSCNGMDPTSFPQGIYTHIYFAFVSINPKSFQVMPYDTSDEKLYPQLASLKTRDPGQEFWLSIGGWTFSDAGSPTATTFSDLVNAPEHRQQAFFTSLILFMQTWRFTGVDIDWEYPVDHDRNGRESDFKAYPRFMKRLKSALSDYKYGLSVTLPTSYWYLQHFDLENIQPSVDWFNVMSYDLHGAWDIGNKWTGAYVGAHSNLTEIKSSLDLLWRNKVSPSKVVLGLSFYGRAVTLADPSCSEPGCPYVSAGDAGQCSNEAGILFNSEISDLIHSKKLRPKLHKDAAVKTIQWNNDQWVSYDDKDTWKLKANFLKSQCLSGVLVWAVDYDDEMHTYSKGLAAALGIKIKKPSDEELTIKLPSKKDDSNDFCYFTNCGQTCPRGYTEIVRGDKPSQLMLDGSQCEGRGTQTLCCPKSSEVPKCQWRGFDNSGHCTVGCNSGEVEVGTIRTGCTKSGWQTACCESTPSTKPWSNCAWTDLCFDDKTCPSGYSTFVVGSREGWGGQRICPKGKNYNYCCTETPKAFKNCEWAAWEDNTPKSGYCTDSCPHGSTRIAEQQVTQMYSGLLPGHAEDCYMGHESFCCSGDQSSGEDEEPQIDYRDNREKEFGDLLDRFLDDPVCLPEWKQQYTGDDSTFDQGLESLEARATDKGPLLDRMIPTIINEVTSQYPDQRMREIFQKKLNDHEYGETAANLTTMQEAIYQSDYLGRPLKPPKLVIVEALCDLENSQTGLENLSTARDALCQLPDGGSAMAEKRRSLQPRAIVDLGMQDRLGDQPTAAGVLRGIERGHLSLHYLRWLRSTPPQNSPPGAIPTQVILEAAYWIGPTPGVTPTDPTIRPRYQDATHTGTNQDRWIVFHFHIPLSNDTFLPDVGGWYLGCDTFSMYHSQNITNPPAVSNHYIPDPRAQYVYTSSYAGGRHNVGPYADYNDRAQPFNCRRTRPRGTLWYIGRDYTNNIQAIRDHGGQGRRIGYAHLVNNFGRTLHQQGVFSRSNLAYIWPQVNHRTTGYPISGNDWGETWYRPRYAAGAFDTNWVANGDPAPDLNAADP